MTSGNGFPYILHDLLKNEAADIVTWTSTGTAFGILDNDAFGQDVLSSYFKHNKFSSFQRQLNLYGFRKVVKGRESGCYMHPSFLRDRPDLLSEVKRGVVPPCPASYTRKVYGSGPRFMNQDDDSDSEPELVIPSRGNRDNKSVDAQQGASPRGGPGVHMARVGNMRHPQFQQGVVPVGGAAGGDPHQGHLRGMSTTQDRTGAGGTPHQHQQHHGVLSGAAGAGATFGGVRHAGGVGVDDTGWRSRPPNSMLAAGVGRGGGIGGGGAGGGGYYRNMAGGMPSDATGGQHYSQLQQLQLQQQHQHLQQQQQRYHMQQQLQPGRFMHRLGSDPAGAGGAAAAGGAGGGAWGAGGTGGEDNLLVGSPVPFLGRFLDSMDSPVADGQVHTPSSMVNFDHVFEDEPKRQQHQEQQQLQLQLQLQQQQQQQQQHFGGQKPAWS